jgi:hypothetical protein
MKNIKDIIIGIFTVIGVLALVTGFTNKVVENEVGTYQIEIESIENGWGTLYRLNTKTGEIVKIKQSALEKIKIN